MVDMEEFSTVVYPAMKIRDLAIAFQAIDADGKFNRVLNDEVQILRSLLKHLCINVHCSSWQAHGAHCSVLQYTTK